MKKTNIVLLVLVIILAVLVAGWVVWKVVSGSEYSAVYLESGDLYFGKLVHFPEYGLKNVYTIQVNPQDQENPVTVQRFVNTIWGPQDFLKINRDNVIWSTGLNPQGQMTQILSGNPGTVPAQ